MVVETADGALKLRYCMVLVLPAKINETYCDSALAALSEITEGEFARQKRMLKGEKLLGTPYWKSPKFAFINDLPYEPICDLLEQVSQKVDAKLVETYLNICVDGTWRSEAAGLLVSSRLVYWLAALNASIDLSIA